MSEVLFPGLLEVLYRIIQVSPVLDLAGVAQWIEYQPVN